MSYRFANAFRLSVDGSFFPVSYSVYDTLEIERYSATCACVRLCFSRTSLSRSGSVDMGSPLFCVY